MLLPPRHQYKDENDESITTWGGCHVMIRALTNIRGLKLYPGKLFKFTFLTFFSVLNDFNPSCVYGKMTKAMTTNTLMGPPCHNSMKRLWMNVRGLETRLS
jgi:hypothetical protein